MAAMCVLKQNLHNYVLYVSQLSLTYFLCELFFFPWMPTIMLMIILAL